MLLIVWHSRTGASRAMAQAALDGAGDAGKMVEAGLVTPEDLLGASGYLFVCPENLGSMSGAMKDMFDRCYYPVLGRIEGRAYACAIAAGSDGRGALAQAERIVTGWRLRKVAEPIIANLGAQTPEEIARPKSVPSEILDKCRQLGMAMALGLDQGIF